MKIVYVETGIKGHKLVYLSNLIKDRNQKDVIIVPERIDSILCKQHIVPSPSGKKRTLRQYMNWLKNIKNIVDQEKPDIVHFLSGDDFYKFFGIGLSMFKRYKVVLTLHWVRSGNLERMSIKSIARRTSMIVVHSAYLKQQLIDFGVKKAFHIEYPQFNQIVVSKEEACKYWGISPDIKTLACIGSTRFDKGIDILMKALEKVNQPFQLLVAGQVNRFTEDDLKEMIRNFSDKVFLNIHYLTDQELAYAFAASDVIVLPYRKSFNGASGPLGEGVSYDKCIVGADHGNLGYTIKKHHLGYTFESENVDDLATIITHVLQSTFIQDQEYKAYKELLNPDIFRKEYLKMYQSL